MEFVTDILKTLDIPQLIAMGVIVWFFYSRLDKKMEKLQLKMDRIDLRVQEVEKEIFAIKLIIHMKDCCMLKDPRLKEKVD